MRGTSAPNPQRVLQWADGDELRWDELPMALRAEVRAVLRTVLQRRVADAGTAEAGHAHE